MCEFCISHGEGKKWYENITNYSRELFLRVNSDQALKNYLAGFGQSMRDNIPRAEKWKKRLPFIYNLLAYPWLSRRFKKNHFGQMVPLKTLKQSSPPWEPCGGCPASAVKLLPGRKCATVTRSAWTPPVSIKTCPISATLT